MTTTTKAARRLLPHPIAMVFPEIDAPTFQDLMASMRSHGFAANHPIMVFEGKILDGRNRYRAAMETGVEPVLMDFHGTREEAAEFSLRENLHRRHLTAGQKAIIAENMLKYIPHVSAGVHPHSGEEVRVKPGKTAKTVAIANHVSPRAVVQAQELIKLDPAAAERVKQGKESLGGALKKAKAAVALNATPAPATDVLGLPIHAVAAEALTIGAAEYRRLILLMRNAKRDVDALIAAPVGRLLNAQQIRVDFENILRQLKFATPYTSCPMDDPCDDKCRVCMGTQWIGKLQFESLPPGTKPVVQQSPEEPEGVAA